MGYAKGFGAVADAVEAGKNRGQNGPRTDIFSWKDGDRKIVRFLSDDPITIGFHSFIKCPDGKNHEFVCGNELAGEKQHDCPIDKTTVMREGREVQQRPSKQTLGLAVEREPITDARGRVIGAKDVLREESITVLGEEIEGAPFVGIIKQSVGNFWEQLNGYYARWGTICDRDYEITRSGKGLDTKYVMVACEPDENLRVCEEGTRFTDVEKTLALLQEVYAVPIAGHPTLVEYIERLGDKSRVETLFLGKRSSSSKPSPTGDDPDHTTPEGDDPAPEPEAKAGAPADDFRSRLMKYNAAK